MNVYYLGTALNVSSMYMVAGVGAAVSLKTGELNLGGEGQIYLGGFCCAVLLSKMAGLPALVALPLALCASFTVSALISLLSAVLKKYRNADFLFTTYIASAAIIPFIDGMISGPFRGKTNNLLATPYIENKLRLPGIMKPSPLNISFFIGIAICVFFFYILFRTAYGRKLCIFGISPQFSKFAGYNTTHLSYSSAIISGGMHGLCGALVITGTYFTCHSGFYSGIGWNSFTAALLSGGNPLFLIPSSLFMGFITTYSSKYSLYHNFGFDMSTLLQAVILFMISFPYLKREVPHHAD